MELLYHYCTVEAFHSIVTSGQVRLSAVRHSNDQADGHMVREAISRHAAAANLSEDAIRRFQKYATELEEEFDGLAFCLSENGDQLSQWRGYANDGRGVSIGFSKQKLEALSKQPRNDVASAHPRLYKAAYTSNEHDAATEELFRELTTIDNLLSNSSSLHRASLLSVDEKVDLIRPIVSVLAYDSVFALKHQAFAEEFEWRLLHHAQWTRERPDGFHPGGARLVPFIAYPLLMNDRSIVQAVILGPRHTSPRATVEQFLKCNGYSDATVRSSCSPYRKDA